VSGQLEDAQDSHDSEDLRDSHHFVVVAGGDHGGGGRRGGGDPLLIVQGPARNPVMRRSLRKEMIIHAKT